MSGSQACRVGAGCLEILIKNPPLSVKINFNVRVTDTSVLRKGKKQSAMELPTRIKNPGAIPAEFWPNFHLNSSYPWAQHQVLIKI